MQTTFSLTSILLLCLFCAQCTENKKTEPTTEKNETVHQQNKEEDPYQLIIYRFNDDFPYSGIVQTIAPEPPEEFNLRQIPLLNKEQEARLSYAYQQTFGVNLDSRIWAIDLLSSMNKEAIKLNREEILAYNHTAIFCYLTTENHQKVNTLVEHYLKKASDQTALNYYTAELSFIEVQAENQPEQMKIEELNTHLTSYKVLSLDDEQKITPKQQIHLKHTLKDGTELSDSQQIKNDSIDTISYKLIHETKSTKFYSKLQIHSTRQYLTTQPAQYKFEGNYPTELQLEENVLQNSKQEKKNLLVTRSYPVPPDFKERLGVKEVYDPQSSIFKLKEHEVPKTPQQMLEHTFKTMGIRLHEGCSIRYIPSISTLYTKLTAIESDKMDAILNSSIGTDPPVQVQVDLQLLKVLTPNKPISFANIDYSTAEIINKASLLNTTGFRSTEYRLQDMVKSCSVLSRRFSSSPLIYTSEFRFQLDPFNDPVSFKIHHPSSTSLYLPLGSTPDYKSLIAVKLDISTQKYDGSTEQ